MKQLRFKLATKFYEISKFIKKRFTTYKNLSNQDKFFRDGGRGGARLLILENQKHVMDFGGYKGEFSEEILKSNPGVSIQLFEPIHEFAQICIAKFRSFPQVQVFDFAIGRNHEQRTFFQSGPSTSQYLRLSQGTSQIVANFVAARDFDDWRNSSLAKINIEGGEYELIPVLSEIGVLPKIQTLLIQFHRTENMDMELCYSILRRTHDQVWSYPFVWERWDKKETINSIDLINKD
jgi:hypothetical protein